jgi:ArsR family transcriptional regulator, arsenate/arsenite/antimonite-responsive transcriptional repressor
MDESDLITMLRALAHPTRLKVMSLLARNPQGLPAGGIAAALQVRQNTLSSHIAMLSRCNLVDGRRTGRIIVYAANFPIAEEMIRYLLKTLGSNALLSKPKHH